MRLASFWRVWTIGGACASVLILMLVGAMWAAPPQRAPVFGPISFSTDLEWDTERVLSSGHKFPEGVLYLCAYWTYRDAAPGTPYKFTWYHGGSVVEEGQATLPSDSGEAKLFFRKPGGYGPDPGVYTLIIELSGQTFSSNPPAMVEPTDNGGGETARCGPLQFRRGYSESSTRIMMAGTRYAQGTKEVLAAWTCRNMRVGAPFRVTWRQGSKTLYLDENKLEYDMTGFFAPLTNPDGSPLAAGVYRLTFTVEGQVWLAGEITVEGLGGFSTQPYFGQLAFWPEFNETQRWPINVGSEFSQGIENIYAFWPYRDVPVNTPLKATWYRDGELFARYEGVFDQLQGIYWIRNYLKDKAALDAGAYRVAVEVNGEIVLADACVVLPAEGNAPSQRQTAEKAFGPVSFASALNSDTDVPLDPGMVFNYGITQLYAYWPHSGVAPGDSYKYAWYHDGEYLDGDSGAFDEGATAAWQKLQYTNRMPLTPGVYEIQIDTGGAALLTGQCMILDSDGPVYGPVVFSSDFNDEDQNPVNIDDQFDYGVMQMYAYWAFQNVPVGKSYRSVWYLDGVSIHEEQSAFEFASGRAWLPVSRTDGAPLKRGNYTFNVFVDGAVVVADQCIIN